MVLGKTIRVGEEAWGVQLRTGKGRAVPSGKWEGAVAPVGKGLSSETLRATSLVASSDPATSRSGLPPRAYPTQLQQPRRR